MDTKKYENVTIYKIVESNEDITARPLYEKVELYFDQSNNGYYYNVGNFKCFIYGDEGVLFRDYYSDDYASAYDVYFWLQERHEDRIKDIIKEHVQFEHDSITEEIENLKIRDERYKRYLEE